MYPSPLFLTTLPFTREHVVTVLFNTETVFRIILPWACVRSSTGIIICSPSVSLIVIKQANILISVRKPYSPLPLSFSLMPITFMDGPILCEENTVSACLSLLTVAYIDGGVMPDVNSLLVCLGDLTLEKSFHLITASDWCPWLKLTWFVRMRRPTEEGPTVSGKRGLCFFRAHLDLFWKAIKIVNLISNRFAIPFIKIFYQPLLNQLTITFQMRPQHQFISEALLLPTLNWTLQLLSTEQGMCLNIFVEYFLGALGAAKLYLVEDVSFLTSDLLLLELFRAERAVTVTMDQPLVDTFLAEQVFTKLASAWTDYTVMADST